MATAAQFDMRLRVAPSRAARAGRRRVRPLSSFAGPVTPQSGQRLLTPSDPRLIRQAAAGEAGRAGTPLPAGKEKKGVRGVGQSPASLDTAKQLGTSRFENPAKAELTMLEWEKLLENPKDKYRKTARLHSELTCTVRGIWEHWLAVRGPGGPRAEIGPVEWRTAYAAMQDAVPGESSIERYQRVKKWLRKFPPSGLDATVLKWERSFTRLRDCQKEWVVQCAACCGDRTPPKVVPIGCDSRLCPLCAWHRSQLARVRIKTLCDKMLHPALITFTVPNLLSIHKADFKYLRGQIRAFLEQRKDMVLGGVYSIETTFNRTHGTWHPHAHALVDLAAPLPQLAGLGKEDMVDFYGRKVFPFVAQKWRWEFDWLQLTGGAKKWGRKPSVDPPAKRPARWLASWDRYHQSLAAWVVAKRKHSTRWAKEWDGEKMRVRADLTPAETARFEELEAWNAENTRVLDIRPVTNRERAAYEVLKYITKCAAFSDLPDVVEAFSNAVRGARLIQTFGSWYGVDLEKTAFDPEHMNDWGERECACGLNVWENRGTVGSCDVRMDIAGQWHLKNPHNVHCLHGRPRIRGSDSDGETSYG